MKKFTMKSYNSHSIHNSSFDIDGAVMISEHASRSLSPILYMQNGFSDGFLYISVCKDKNIAGNNTQTKFNITNCRLFVPVELRPIIEPKISSIYCGDYIELWNTDRYLDYVRYNMQNFEIPKNIRIFL